MKLVSKGEALDPEAESGKQDDVYVSADIYGGGGGVQKTISKRQKQDKSKQTKTSYLKIEPKNI